MAPDRSLWAGMARTDHEEDCAGGVGNFDGSTWSGYLPDLCVTAMDIADDGSVWLLAVDGPDDARSDLYVITPEAAAANE